MKYCVTVVRYGSIFVEADSPWQAMDIANHQETDSVSWNEEWDPTDAEEDYEGNEPHYFSEYAF